MAKPKQVEMFEQKRIPTIEKWADTFDEKRQLVSGLTAERDNALFKLAEAMHKNEAALDRQSDAKGGTLLVYKRGDYTITVKGKETVNVKIKAASKPPVEGVPESESPSKDEDGE